MGGITDLSIHLVYFDDLKHEGKMCVFYIRSDTK